MDHPDIIHFLCNFLNDIDKFSYLSVTKNHDILKDKLWFSERINLFRIYGHRYFNRFTNVIVCKRMKKWKNFDLPLNVRKIDCVADITIPRIPNGLTHYRPFYDDLRDMPKSITHLTLVQRKPGNYIPNNLKSLNNLKYLKLIFCYERIDLEDLLPSNLTHFRYCDGIDHHYYPIPSNLEYLFTNMRITITNPIPNLSYCEPISNLENMYTGLKKLSLSKYDPTCGSLSYLINLDFLKIRYLTETIDDEFPPNITVLKVDNCYRAIIKKLPQTLIKISLHDIKTLQYKINLPNLTHLSTSDASNHFSEFDVVRNYRNNTFDMLVMPKLYYLTINNKNMPSKIPSEVRYLKTGKYTIYDLFIPSFITHLSFNNNFNQSINKIIHSNITHLRLGKNFFNANLYIPSTVSHLTLSSRCYTANKNILRNRNLSITIEHVYEKDPFRMDKF